MACEEEHQAGAAEQHMGVEEQGAQAGQEEQQASAGGQQVGVAELRAQPVGQWVTQSAGVEGQEIYEPEELEEGGGEDSRFLMSMRHRRVSRWHKWLVGRGRGHTHLHHLPIPQHPRSSLSPGLTKL